MVKLVGTARVNKSSIFNGITAHKGTPLEKEKFTKYSNYMGSISVSQSNNTKGFAFGGGTQDIKALMNSTLSPGCATMRNPLNITNEFGVNFLYRVDDENSVSGCSNRKLPFDSHTKSFNKDEGYQIGGEMFSAAKNYKKRRGQIEEYLARVSRD